MSRIENNKEIIVIDLFLTLKENTIVNIASKTNLLEITVHKIINKFLKSKTING
jgi:hypothetical protein